MAYVRIVTNKKGITVRDINMDGETIAGVDKVATAIDSLICEERDALHVDVDYSNCIEE
jgi:hypothetical protein